jgi:hypothetical protein
MATSHLEKGMPHMQEGPSPQQMSEKAEKDGATIHVQEVAYAETNHRKLTPRCARAI